MSCSPCPFERGSSGEWPPGPRERTLKGRGSWDGQAGLFGALGSGCLPSWLCARGGEGAGGDRVQLWDACPPWGGDVTVPTDTMPRLCPAPGTLSPRSGAAGTVNKWQEASGEGERAPDHVSQEAGLSAEEAVKPCGGTGLPRGASAGVIPSHRVGHQPESHALLGPVPATGPKTPPPAEPHRAKPWALGDLRSAGPPTPR